jgi:hypothetical protein
LPFLFVQQSFVLFSVFLCYILLQPWLYTQILCPFNCAFLRCLNSRVSICAIDVCLSVCIYACICFYFYYF